MWVIFIDVFIAAALAAMALIWIGHKISLAMRRDEREFDVENQIYEETKKQIKKSMEEKEE